MLWSICFCKLFKLVSCMRSFESKFFNIALSSPNFFPNLAFSCPARYNLWSCSLHIWASFLLSFTNSSIWFFWFALSAFNSSKIFCNPPLLSSVEPNLELISFILLFKSSISSSLFFNWFSKQFFSSNNFLFTQFLSFKAFCKFSLSLFKSWIRFVYASSLCFISYSKRSLDSFNKEISFSNCFNSWLSKSKSFSPCSSWAIFEFNWLMRTSLSVFGEYKFPEMHFVSTFWQLFVFMNDDIIILI